MLNLNTKIIENKHFIRHFKRFLQTLSVTRHLNTKHLNTITIVAVLAHFLGPLAWMQDCFQYKLSPVWSYIFIVVQTRNQNKKEAFAVIKWHSKQREAKSIRQSTTISQLDFFGMLSQGLCADWLVCIAYCIFWNLIGSDQLSFFLRKQESLPIISKGKSDLKLSNWTVCWQYQLNHRLYNYVLNGWLSFIVCVGCSGIKIHIVTNILTICLGSLQTPYVALINGITMGGVSKKITLHWAQHLPYALITRTSS